MIDKPFVCNKRSKSRSDEIELCMDIAVETMRKHYDFSNAGRNPYARRLKQQVTIRLDRDTIAYFKRLAEQTVSVS